VPGRNPQDAVVSFLDPLQEALAVLDGYSKIIVAKRGAYRQDVPYVWIINDEEGMELRGVGRLRATMQFKIVQCDPSTNDAGHPLRVTTLGYNYKISDVDDRDRIRFHWHPTGAGKNLHPHVHALPDLSTHVYLPRVTLESVIRACLELGAPLTVDAGEAITHLAVTEAAHMLNRTWTDWPPGRAEPYRTAIANPRTSEE
jgi:hypothetical protein